MAARVSRCGRRRRRMGLLHRLGADDCRLDQAHPLPLVCEVSQMVGCGIFGLGVPRRGAHQVCLLETTRGLAYGRAHGGGLCLGLAHFAKANRHYAMQHGNRGQRYPLSANGRLRPGAACPRMGRAPSGAVCLCAQSGGQRKPAPFHHCVCLGYQQPPVAAADQKPGRLHAPVGRTFQGGRSGTH